MWLFLKYKKFNSGRQSSYAIGSECLERFSAKFRCGRSNRCREMAFFNDMMLCCMHLLCVSPSVRPSQVGTAHDSFWILMPSVISPEWLKRDSTFNMQVDYIKCYPCHDKLPANGRGYGDGMVMVTWPVFNLGLQSCLWNQWSLAFQISCPDRYRGVLEHTW